jgi:hypothetical protein
MCARLGALVLSFLLTIPALAIDLGKAEGTVTINKKPVKLKYAYAKKEKDYEEKDRWVLTLTDRAVSRSVLADSNRFSQAVGAGELVAVSVTFDAAKEVESSQASAKGLRSGTIPMGFDLSGVTVTDKAVEGSLKADETEFFDDTASMSAKFNAAIGTNPASESELASKRPKIAEGGATGSFTLDGKTVKLAHSIARTKPNSFDEKKKDVVLLLTNEPVAPELFVDELKLSRAVQDGTLRGLKVTIDVADEKPYHLEMLDPKGGFQISGSGFWNLDFHDISDKRVGGRFFTTEEQTFTDAHKYTYDVSFATPVQRIK